MNNIFKQLETLFAISDFEQKREKLAFFTVEKRHLVPALKFAKENFGFGHLILITAVDWLENGFFQITYLVKNNSNQFELGFKVFIPRNDAVMESVHDLWKAAATYQRELKEMFGIDFPGSPGVDESFILEGWHDIPPYRRDFDTKKYSEETYFPRPGRVTHDPEEHMKKKLYPQREG
jgi:NADH-quinone oxidoreductase subunit C